MTKAAAILFAIVILLASCSSDKGLEIEQVLLVTKNPEKLADWYVTNFGFDRLENELTYDNFKIRLKKNEDAANPEALKEAFHLQQIPGFYKLGFVTNQFEELIDRLRQNDVTFVGGETYSEKIDKKWVTVKDPDGNYIRIFEGEGRHRLRPYYIAVVVESIGEQEKWYQMKLPVSKTHNLDLPEKNVFVRLLEGENFLIELIDTSNETVKKELDKHEQLGINSVVVRGANARFEKDHEGNLIIHQ